jgi:hypothetical protein
MSTVSSTENKSTQVASHRVRAGKRSYFFDVYAGPKGGLHLCLSETVAEENGFKRSRVVVFDNSIREFYEGLCEAIRAMREEQKKREAAAAPAEPARKKRAA